MQLPIELKHKAIRLRKKGYSIKEVALKLKIARGTSSIWLRDVILSQTAQTRLEKRKILGQYKSRLNRIEKREIEQRERFKRATKILSKIDSSKELYKLCCALIHWCEGNKDKDTSVRFTSSDPSLIRIFLYLLRKGFNANEEKLRVLMHLHGYHNEKSQKDFWNKITKIPKNQFNRTYWKPNTGKRKQENYPGCIAISYYDAKVAKELMAIYNAFAQRGVG